MLLTGDGGGLGIMCFNVHSRNLPLATRRNSLEVSEARGRGNQLEKVYCNSSVNKIIQIME